MSPRRHALFALPVLALLALYGAAMLGLGRLSLCEGGGRSGFGLGAFYRPGTFTLAAYRDLLSDRYFREVFGFSMALGVGLSASVLVIALVLALGIRRLRRGARSLALLAVFLPKLANVLVIIYGLDLLLGDAGPVNRALMALHLRAEPLPLLHNLGAVIIGEGYLILPYAVLVLVLALDGVDPTLESAARGLGMGRLRTLWRVTLPLIAPALGVAALLSFIWAFGAFVGPLLLGSPEEMTLAVDIQKQTFENLAWPRGAAEAMLLVATVAIGLLVLRPGPGSTTPAASPLATAGPASPVDGLTLGALAILLVPLGYSIWISFTPGELLEVPTTEWSLRWYRELFRRPEWTGGLRQSLVVGAEAVALALLGGTGAALVSLRESSRLAQLISRVVLLPLFTPAIVLALGLLPLMHQTGLYGQSVSIAIGHALWGLPVVYLVVRRGLKALDPRLAQAARGLGATPTLAWRRITLPLLLPTLIAGGLMALVLSLNEFEIALFLGTPEIATLPKIIWPNLRYTLSPLVAAASTVTLTTTLASLIAIGLLLRVRSKGTSASRSR